MENQKSTHFIFDGKKIIISPDLILTATFLGEIGKEIESFLGFEEKLDSIRKQTTEIFDFIEFVSKKLKENKIDFSFTFLENPEKIVEKLEFHRPIRSEIIILFANLETLLRLNFAYENEMFEEEKIRNISLKKEVWEKFYNEFCLSEDNIWVIKNKEKAKIFTAQDLRYLRNSLTHFFSLSSKIQVIHPELHEKAKRLENALNSEVVFLSSGDLYEIIKGSFILMMKRWSRDCEECSFNGSDVFKKRIFSVNNLIKDSGAIVVDNRGIKI